MNLLMRLVSPNSGAGDAARRLVSANGGAGGVARQLVVPAVATNDPKRGAIQRRLARYTDSRADLAAHL